MRRHQLISALKRDDVAFVCPSTDAEIDALWQAYQCEGINEIADVTGAVVTTGAARVRLFRPVQIYFTRSHRPKSDYAEFTLAYEEKAPPDGFHALPSERADSERAAVQQFDTWRECMSRKYRLI